MSQTGWQRLWDVFFAALERPDSEREAFLAEACGADASLRQTVAELLAARERSPGFLERPAAVATPIGRQIGRYRVLREIGSGGMGTVYEAEQEQPLRRRVALKLIKLGMDTREVVARFEAERQALALMNHACIARVFDGGATEDGRPYFVMELVDGVPLTEYCDRERLSVPQRLHLFVKVCEGVQHAHHKGVIHRDIKPANVLVGIEDGVALPKIIDFGVARAIRPAGAAQTAANNVYTQLGMLIGTPAYMSPEQLDPDGTDVDTRTDIYGLCVLLYELLCGSLPFDTASLRRKGLGEMQRAIRETRPQRPGARYAQLDPAAAGRIAGQRQTSPPQLVRALRGDLDQIVLKGLAKERSERYDTPRDLAADLQRHLTQQPIQAHPPGTAYRARKFVRRHRLGVAVAAAALLLLVAFAVAMTLQSLRLQRALASAEAHSRRAQQANDFLVTLFEQASPDVTKGRALTVREVLDAGAAKIGQELGGQPSLAANLHFTLGIAYKALGAYDQGAQHVDAAYRLRQQHLGDDDPLTLDALSALAQLRWDQGDRAAAEQLARRALAGQDRVLPHDHEQRLQTLNTLALAIKRAGRYAEAEPIYREVVEARRRTLGAEHRSTLIATSNLARLLEDTRRPAEAEQLMRQVVDTGRRVYGEDDPDTLISLDILGVLARKLGRLDEAENLHRLALAGARRVLGERHMDTLAIRRNLALLLMEKNQLAQAEPLLRETLAIVAADYGESTFYTMATARTLGDCLLQQGRMAEAEQMFRRARDIGLAVLPAEHETNAAIAAQLATTLMARGAYAEAEPLLLASYPILLRVRGEQDVYTAQTRAHLAELYRKTGRSTDAQRYDAARPTPG